MKRFAFLLLPLLIAYACSNGKPRLVNKRRFKEQKEKIQESIDTEDSSPTTFIENLPEYVKSELETNSIESQESTANESTPLGSDGIWEEPSPSTENTSITPQKHSKSSKSSSKKSSRSPSGGIIVLGIILLLAGIIIATLYATNASTSSDPQGCFEEFVLLILIIILCVALSVIGLILIITGLIAFATGKALYKRRQKLKARKK